MPELHKDMIDLAAGLSKGGAIHSLRRQRGKVLAATRGSYDALFAPALDGLSPAERLLVALYACHLTPAPELALRYRNRHGADAIDPALLALVERGERDETAIAGCASPREAAMLGIARLLVDRPVEGDKSAIAALTQVGLSTPGVVALAQLIGFVTYQTRLVAGLQALKALLASGERSSQAARSVSSSAQRAATGQPQPMAEPIRINGFTNEPLSWRAWLPVVDLGAATQEQIEVLEESHPQARSMDYYLLLAHQSDVLRQRSAAFNAIMYAPGGLPRAERELASTVVSRINGCVYCASVHAQRFEQLAKRTDVIEQLFNHPARAGTTEREQAIVAFSIALTERPGDLKPADLAPLVAVGLSSADLLDLIHSIAIFAWANRLMLNLGEPVASA